MIFVTGYRSWRQQIEERSNRQAHYSGRCDQFSGGHLRAHLAGTRPGYRIGSGAGDIHCTDYRGE